MQYFIVTSQILLFLNDRALILKSVNLDSQHSCRLSFLSSNFKQAKFYQHSNSFPVLPTNVFKAHIHYTHSHFIVF